ncbi:MAG: polysaccharide deacetylase family protein [Anaerolineae bacterium]
MTGEGNKALQRIGLSANDRAVIIHADDIGMCHATVTAFEDVIDFGLVRSGAVMVPCPWFPTVAQYARDNPGIDIGVHATVTCEWTSMRWGPISTVDPDSGLLDAQGYFHRRSSDVQQAAAPHATEVEIAAQIARAIDAGIDVTHVDQHMFAVGHPRLFRPYLNAVIPHMLPPLLLRGSAYHRMGYEVPDSEQMAQTVRYLEEQGYASFDSVIQLPLTEPAGQVELVKQLLSSLEPGLHLMIMHPVRDTPEVRAIIPHWQARVANYEAMLSKDLLAHLGNLGIQSITYRDLRDCIPGRQ